MSIVSLRGEEIKPPGEPNPEAVEAAERLLELARSGEINTIFAVVQHADESVSAWRRGSITNRLIGLSYQMLHEMHIERVND